MDLDFALEVDSPPPLTHESTFNDKKRFEKLGESNRVCIIITKKNILNVFRGSMFEKITMAAEFFANIKNRFVKSEKKKNSNRYTLTSLISIRYMGKGKKKKQHLKKKKN